MKNYDDEFVDDCDGVCQYTFVWMCYTGLCDDCRKIVQNNSRCKAKSKFILKHKDMEFRDVAVCGTHKNMLMLESYRPLDWEVVAHRKRAGDHFARQMVAADIKELAI